MRGRPRRVRRLCERRDGQRRYGARGQGGEAALAVIDGPGGGDDDGRPAGVRVGSRRLGRAQQQEGTRFAELLLCRWVERRDYRLAEV